MPDPVAPVRALAAATGLLTRIPVGAASSGSDIVRGAALFPLIGAAIGAIVGSAAIGLATIVPALAAAAIAVGLELVLTGCLHVDGLADSADGLAGRDPDHALRIMRDHSLGTYGASALIIDLIAKTVALGPLAEDGEALTVVAAFAVSRATPLPLAATLSYARAGGGTGRLLADRLRPRSALAGLALAALLALVLAGVTTAAAMLASLLTVTGAVGLVAQRRLGGVTGDVMGAAIELCAASALLVALAV